MYVDKRILTILVLSVTACLLMLADFGSTPARGDLVIKDRDYQMITGKGTSGGDDLYVLDGRTGLMAVFIYDPTRRGVFPRAFTSVADLFGPPR